MDERKDFEYEQYEIKEKETKVEKHIKNFEKKYFRFQLKNKLVTLFSIIFMAAYISVSVLTNNFGTPTWTILLGIPLSYFIINVIFNKQKIFSFLYFLIIIIYFIISVILNKWDYTALILLLIPIVSALKAVILETSRIKKAGKE